MTMSKKSSKRGALARKTIDVKKGEELKPLEAAEAKPFVDVVERDIAETDAKKAPKRTSCPACGSKETKSRFADKQFHEWNVCVQCGGWWMSDLRTDEEQRAMIEKSAADRIQLIEAMKATAADVWRWMDRVIWNAMTKRGLLVDVGCSWGYFGELAQRNGWQVVGIEPSKFAADEIAQRVPQMIVHNCMLDDLKTEIGGDVVVCIEVFEHVEKPLDFIGRVLSLVKEDGFIVFSTPNVESCSARAQGQTWGAIIGEHIYMFAFSFLEEQFRKRGWQIFNAFDVPGLNGYNGTSLCFARRLPEHERHDALDRLRDASTRKVPGS